jgi:hypothetical protein
LLERPAEAPEVCAARAAIPHSRRVRTLLAGQWLDGGFGVLPDQKWTGAHWRLVSLVELGLPPGTPHALQAVEQVLSWLTSAAHRKRIVQINGRTRRCASQEGNALAAGCRLGLAGDRRLAGLAQALVSWQWPDGGWNCDPNPAAAHSSFYESLAPLWGLIEYHCATGDDASQAAARRAAEFFLRHRLFRSDRTGAVIDPEWLRLHYPVYWHYDILQALVILGRLGPLHDPRLDEALDALMTKRRPDGTWAPERRYWRLAPAHPEARRGAPPARPPTNAEVVDWGRSGPNAMLTLNALRVLKAAGRL